MSFSGWLQLLPWVLVLVAWWQRLSLFWVLLGLGLALSMRLAYWRAKRKGYIGFVPTSERFTANGARHISDNERVTLRATGLFSVSHREEYLLQRPAEYWRVPLGDHAFMVQQESGRYLYQFVQSGALRQVRSGYLVFGLRPQNALEVTFFTTWGPEYAEGNVSQFMPGRNDSPNKLKRTVYLCFGSRVDKQSVWQNLLRDAEQAIDEPLYDHQSDHL